MEHVTEWANQQIESDIIDITGVLHAAPTVATAIYMVREALSRAADINGHRAKRLLRAVSAINFAEGL